MVSYTPLILIPARRTRVFRPCEFCGLTLHRGSLGSASSLISAPSPSSSKPPCWARSRARSCIIYARMTWGMCRCCTSCAASLTASRLQLPSAHLHLGHSPTGDRLAVGILPRRVLWLVKIRPPSELVLLAEISFRVEASPALITARFNPLVESRARYF